LPGEVLTVRRVTIAIGEVDAERRQQELERRSTFVLITTVSAEVLSAAALLAEYKGQVHVERHFHFLKDPLFVDALYVKKPERVEVSGYVLLLACLLYSLVERRVRAAKVAIPSPSRRVLKNPTGHEIVRHLESLQVTRDSAGKRTVALPSILHATLAAILDALHMPITVFTEPPLREPPR
jgi:transposase